MQKKYNDIIKKNIDILEKNFPISGYIPTDKTPYVNIIKFANNYLKKGSKVLDFGSGPMDKLVILKLMGMKCTAFDDLGDAWHTENTIKKIKKYAKDNDIEYITTIKEIEKIDDDSLDLVMTHDVLEHLHDSPRKIMELLVSKLKKDGYVFITVPNAVNIKKRFRVLFGKTNLPDYDDYFFSKKWRGHVREYCQDDLKRLTKNLNLKRIELKGVDHMLFKLPKPIIPLYKVITFPIGSFKDSLMLVAQKKPFLDY